MNKPEQLRLAADIIEGNLVWQNRQGGPYNWSADRIGDEIHLCYCLRQDCEIRLAPPSPEPVALGPEDVPPGSAIRRKEWSDEPAWWGITAATSSGAYAGAMHAELHRWDSLAAHFEIKRPGQDWQPCSKPA